MTTKVLQDDESIHDDYLDVEQTKEHFQEGVKKSISDASQSYEQLLKEAIDRASDGFEFYAESLCKSKNMTMMSSSFNDSQQQISNYPSTASSQQQLFHVTNANPPSRMATPLLQEDEPLLDTDDAIQEASNNYLDALTRNRIVHTLVNKLEGVNLTNDNAKI
eukprot:CAMPEP_0117419586 /NCGR_PEP_ID=MMETSP0758-20121206/1111_1 /TAXON_ID=63605 /ORGANISM="Percolomonas cosmopolitus, Strain AE-1 (ATCC 50343)" /LENGTH=162 /DNA_ID=CAMNT_0005200725 /DNA_START=157 /DNA_END=642 /DNA_ORIENTATION=+